MIISVIGSSNPPNQEHVDLAEAVGRELAKRGIMLVCGGLSGIMEAACRGAKSEGGVTIGILPGRAANDANNFVDIPIVTAMGYARNVIVVHTGRAVIAVGGAFGTLSEIGHALGDGIPVIGLNSWEFSRNGDGTLVNDSIIPASDPVDAVEKAVAAAAARDKAEQEARAAS